MSSVGCVVKHSGGFTTVDDGCILCGKYAAGSAYMFDYIWVTTPQDQPCVHEYCYLSVHTELPQRCQIPTYFVGLLIFFPGSGESSVVAIILLLSTILGQFTLN